MQAVIGRIQLAKMAGWTQARTGNARIIDTALKPFAGPTGPIRAPAFHCAGCEGCPTKAGCVHAYYKYYAYVRAENLAPKWNRDRIVEEIKALGVPCFQGSCSEVYREKAFSGTGWRPKKPLPVAHELGETSLMFLVHPTLTDSEMSKTAWAIGEILSQAGR